MIRTFISTCTSQKPYFLEQPERPNLLEVVLYGCRANSFEDRDMSDHAIGQMRLLRQSIPQDKDWNKVCDVTQQ